METQIDVKNPKLKRTLERFKAKIAEGDFYEAHQTLRTIANRNVRSKSYADAIDLLYHAAQILLKSSQPATGSDLTSYLIEVYVESETPVTNESKSKLIHLIQLFSPEEPTLKQVAVESVNWSVKFGDYKFGDPELHHALGSKLVENGALAYDAEKHLLLGTSASVPLYIKHIWEWYTQDDEATIGVYTLRIVVNYLLVSNIKAANDALATILKNIASERPSLTSEIVTESEYTVSIFETQPLLNLAQLLLCTIQKADQKLFKTLRARYNQAFAQAGYNDAFTLLGEMYFGIAVPKQANFLQDMMGSFFGANR
ncbi:Golgi to ER traffic protein 4 [Cyberlindnera fabianii]|uniref:Golgi to ER traffic protein 4 n=1 Tax=Cyberlindnera fabianii TaxID=36022 RepID=A0A1V2L5S1_CYBFA|nr:Golgi to ER traffic protein 4 [Cyberlindnera fabianii]